MLGLGLMCYVGDRKYANCKIADAYQTHFRIQLNLRYFSDYFIFTILVGKNEACSVLQSAFFWILTTLPNVVCTHTCGRDYGETLQRSGFFSLLHNTPQPNTNAANEGQQMFNETDGDNNQRSDDT